MSLLDKHKSARKFIGISTMNNQWIFNFHDIKKHRVKEEKPKCQLKKGEWGKCNFYLSQKQVNLEFSPCHSFGVYLKEVTSQKPIGFSFKSLITFTFNYEIHLIPYI